MVRPGGDVLSLRAYVQLPQHVSDELLHVLMATVVEGDARALSAHFTEREQGFRAIVSTEFRRS